MRANTRLIELPNMSEIQTVIPKGIGIDDLEGRRLAKLAKDREVIVEIGAHRGRSAAFLASGLKYSKTNGKIISIDLWQEKNHLEAYHRNLKGLGLEQFTETIQGASENIVKTWQQPIDLLFIDGNHSYFHVKQDYELWSPFVVKGGLIVFHDYGNPSWEGVRRFVDTLHEKELLCIGVHYSIWSGIKQ